MPRQPKPCKPGQERNAKGRCVKQCPVGIKRQKNGKCAPITVKQWEELVYENAELHNMVYELQNGQSAHKPRQPRQKKMDKYAQMSDYEIRQQLDRGKDGAGAYKHILDLNARIRENPDADETMFANQFMIDRLLQGKNLTAKQLQDNYEAINRQVFPQRTLTTKQLQQNVKAIEQQAPRRRISPTFISA